MDDERIHKGHGETSNFLRVLGPLLMVVGGLFLIIGIGSFFAAFGGSGPPRYFWCAFIGIPLLGIGGILTKFGYMGKIARYMSQEFSPVAKDTFNYMADETQDGVKTLAQAFSEGISSNLKDGPVGENKKHVRCHKCNKLMEEESKFCSDCGAALTKTKDCPMCNEINDPDAKFCDNCGHKYV